MGTDAAVADADTAEPDIAVTDTATTDTAITDTIKTDTATADAKTDTTPTANNCAATKKDCKAEGYCYDLSPSTCKYLTDHKLSHPACTDIATTKNEPVCVSSTTDKASPYFNSKECPLVQFWSNPTDLPIDCRCAGKLESLCKRPYTLPASFSVGTGPRPRSLASTVQAWNGLLYKGEWFLPVGWSTAIKKSQTMIFAIDIKTGNRRHFSGAFDDPALGYTSVAKGDIFVNVMDIKLGPDGMFYAMGGTSDIAPPKVWKIDPVSGDRTLIFDEEKADSTTLCANGSTLPGKKVIQMVPEAFAMDATGNFYFGYINMPGRGVVKFSKDFSKCEFLTMVPDLNQSTTMKTAIGSGYDSIQFEMRALEINGDKLYAVADTKLIEVDLATGARKMISNAKEMGGLGAGPINAEGLGDRWSKWDPYRKVLWTHGINGGNGAIAVDLTSGDRTTWPCWHPGMGILGGCGGTGLALIPGYLSYGGMIIDPDPPHNLYFAHDLFSVVKYEVKTGNAHILSL